MQGNDNRKLASAGSALKQSFRGPSLAHEEMIAHAQQLGEGAGAMYFSKVTLDTLPTGLPEEPSPSDVVYRHIHDLRLLDSNPRLNLASYVTTWMEEPAQRLMMESMTINHADSSIYSSSKAIETKCLNIMAELFHAEDPSNPTGCATVGSTEACLLGGLNLKKRWMEARRAKGLPTDKPNLIVSYTFQVCWEKFCKYWDVEMRLGHIKEGSYVLNPEDVERLADENTIGIVAILGNTYTGHLDDVAALDRLCNKLRDEKGLDLMIHVDGASGGFVVPFLYPEFMFDFRLQNVISICASGHKYGMVYPGIGWQVWRSAAALHPDLVFHLGYLGTDQVNYTLNFSRPASQIVASYYQFLRLGRKGFNLVAHNTQKVAVHLARGIEKLGSFYLLNDPMETVPIVTFAFKPHSDAEASALRLKDVRLVDQGDGNQSSVQVSKHARPYTEFELVEKLKERGWSVPAYALAPDCGETIVCRCVVREEFSITLADEFLKDLKTAVTWLDAHFAGRTREERDQIVELTQHIAPHKTKAALKSLESMRRVC